MKCQISHFDRIFSRTINPFMIHLIGFCFFVFIKTERCASIESIVLIEDDKDEQLKQLKALDEDDWDIFDKDLKKGIADFIKKEYEPMGQLFDPLIDVDLDYYEKINSFVINRIKMLNDNLELFMSIDEAIDFLDYESMSFDDMSDIHKKISSIEKINLDELKNSDFYFYLLKENIQLHHVNLFMFIFQNITRDMTAGCYYMIEFLNCGKKKIFYTRQKIVRPRSMEIREVEKYWNSLGKCVEPTSCTPEQKLIKKMVDLIMKNIDEIIKNEINLEFILLIFRNLSCLQFIIDHFYQIRRTIFFKDVILRPRFYDNYHYYEEALENNKKFREYVLFFIRKKNDWTQIRLFYFFDNPNFFNMLIR
ncbi:hypothetical protein NBO_6g0086 [Nosema bombycis CQ1]|uniref:Uncharacterized protein n=1 Tax=Nosema bombycis (strain CQ1 / CVCC 102059) TaxID=578461 RepID=R0MM94_NOSB1|nr:hypothetical protein NBO_6g0086 [Nosema bombycis CQ1]|eukprot:EOB15335.1 hypothetical protein NBO_6g0086 [Nosema bombycis CQ1]